MKKTIALLLLVVSFLFAAKIISKTDVHRGPGWVPGEQILSGSFRTDTIAFSDSIEIGGLSKGTIYITGMDSAYCVIWGQIGGLYTPPASPWFKAVNDTIKASGRVKLDSIFGGLTKIRFEILKKVDTNITVIFYGKTR